MPGTLQRRIDKALDIIAGAVHLAYRLALILIIAVAALLSLVAWYVYPPLIFIIVLVAVLAAWYATTKKDEIAEIIDDADDESAIPQGRASSGHSRLRTMPKRIIDKVLDSALSTLLETAMFVPGGCAFLAALAFVFGYNGFGCIAAVVSLTLFLFIACILSILRHVANQWINSLFGESEGPHASEQSPLLE